MDKAAVEWTLSREPARLPSGPFTDAGFRFTEVGDWWWDEEESEGRLHSSSSLAGERTAGCHGSRRSRGRWQSGPEATQVTVTTRGDAASGVGNA